MWTTTAPGKNNGMTRVRIVQRTENWMELELGRTEI